MLIKSVYATCPVCVVTVGGGLIIAKKLGIDDLVVSIWISGLNTALAFWIAASIKKRILNHPILWSLGFYILTLIYLWHTKQLFHPKNTFLGFDKVIFGMTIGLLIFLLSALIDKIIRYNNQRKVLFNYQKVIIPFVFLLITTFIFKLIL